MGMKQHLYPRSTIFVAESLICGSDVFLHEF